MTMIKMSKVYFRLEIDVGVVPTNPYGRAAPEYD
jgi:hypothetical protein